MDKFLVVACIFFFFSNRLEAVITLANIQNSPVEVNAELHNRSQAQVKAGDLRTAFLLEESLTIAEQWQESFENLRKNQHALLRSAIETLSQIESVYPFKPFKDKSTLAENLTRYIEKTSNASYLVQKFFNSFKNEPTLFYLNKLFLRFFPCFGISYPHLHSAL